MWNKVESFKENSPKFDRRGTIFSFSDEMVKADMTKRHRRVKSNKGWFKKGHQMQKGVKNSRWNGGRTKNFKGYIFIKQPHHPFCNSQGYIFEHRLVVEAQIGRYLEPKNETHHLGAKDDNRPQMLMAFVNTGAHKRFENGKRVKPEEIIFDGRQFVNKKE